MERAREGSVPGKSNDEATLPLPLPPLPLQAATPRFLPSCLLGLDDSFIHVQPDLESHHFIQSLQQQLIPPS